MDLAAEKLRDLGFEATDDVVGTVGEMRDAFLENIRSNAGMPDTMKQILLQTFQSERQCMLDILRYLGMGRTDPDTGVWIPRSRLVYSFDAEVFDIDRMYTCYLQGVQSIVPGAAFTDVREDTSGMWRDMIPSQTFDGAYTDGKRSVSFRYNGHPYSVELESLGDWINPDILDFVNGVLRQEGCAGQIRQVSDEWDQYVLLIFGSEEWETEVRRALYGG